MKITDELLDKIARLSMLSFQENEKEKYKTEFQRTLDFVEKLQEVDTTGVEPLIHITEEVATLRPDEVDEGVSTEEALQNAPEKDGNFFLVPKVVKE